MLNSVVSDSNKVESEMGSTQQRRVIFISSPLRNCHFLFLPFVLLTEYSAGSSRVLLAHRNLVILIARQWCRNLATLIWRYQLIMIKGWQRPASMSIVLARPDWPETMGRARLMMNCVLSGLVPTEPKGRGECVSVDWIVIYSSWAHSWAVVSSS